MGQQQSKDELLYQQVNYGNSEGIKALCREGAGLEWIDRDGKTPLILACMNPELHNVAKTLIELGANVNVYRPGRNAGTPLHHAAKRGLENTVKLLLSHGANALVMNDDCQTPLEVARAKGFSNVVRAIENHICLFAGWLREFYGPGFLEVLAPQFVSRKVWVVVLPCGSRNLAKPFKLELAIYSSLQCHKRLESGFPAKVVRAIVIPQKSNGNPFGTIKIRIPQLLFIEQSIRSTLKFWLKKEAERLLAATDAQPRTVIALWKANLEEPKFHQPDPSAIIIDTSTITRGRRRRRRICTSRELRCRPQTNRQTRIKLGAADDNDKHQLRAFCDACKGIPQAMQPTFLHTSQTPGFQATAPPTAEDLDLAMAINASIHTAMAERPNFDAQSSTEGSSSTSWNNSLNTGSHSGIRVPLAPSSKASGSQWAGHEGGQNVNLTPSSHIQSTDVSLIQTTINAQDSVPSAPPIVDEIIEDGPIQYPSIDSSPVDVSSPTIGNLTASERKEEGGASSSCVICLDAPVEGACIPCGHMAGCMSCLKEINAKKWGCPVCRAKIDQVIRLYSV